MLPAGTACLAVRTLGVLVLAFSSLAPVVASESLRDRLGNLYRFDPAEHERLNAPVTGSPRTQPPAASPQTAPAPVLPDGLPRPRVPDPAMHIPEASVATSETAVQPDHTQAAATLELPKMIVPGKQEKAPPALPRLHVEAPVRNVGNGHPFETKKARIERLTKKYYSPASQRLNRLLLNPVGSWAARDAAIADSSAQINDLAQAIELALATGLLTPEERSQLLAEYQNLLATKPR